MENIKKNMELDCVETFDFIKNFSNLLKVKKVNFIWVEGTLCVYPDNYLNTLETSWYLNILYIRNFDKLDYDNEDETFEIDFEIDFETIEELVEILTSIKNNTICKDLLWYENVENTFYTTEKRRKQEIIANEYFNSLSFEQLNDIKKSLETNIDFCENMNNCNIVLSNLKQDLVNVCKRLETIEK